MIPRRIVVFGSSTVYGTADTEKGGFVNRLRLWHESVDARNRVYNLGIWGEGTESLIERIAGEARARRPHLILVYPGFNDCRRVGSREAPNASTIGEFGELMRRLIGEAKGVADTVVMTGYPFDESRTCPYPGSEVFYCLSDARAYTERLVAVTTENGVGVLDFFGAFGRENMTGLLAEDGLHGNAECHKRLFERTRDFLRERYGEANS
ncbi:MAG: GDSL-type esterase/lipase family protein [Verrucomicrobiota bacterium]